MIEINVLSKPDSINLIFANYIQSVKTVIRPFGEISLFIGEFALGLTLLILFQIVDVVYQIFFADA